VDNHTYILIYTHKIYFLYNFGYFLVTFWLLFGYFLVTFWLLFGRERETKKKFEKFFKKTTKL
jgi:hypothetical protein